MASRRKIRYRLIHAVREGRLETVRELINSYGLSQEQLGGYVLLCDALLYSHTEIAELLLTSGSKVNSDNVKPSDTPLHLAAINGNRDIVKMLLDKGAKIDVKDTDGRSPLHCAIVSKNMAVIELLLNYGADVNVKGEDYITPLHVAAEERDESIVEHLLNCGACIDSSTLKEGHTPLNFAIGAGHHTAVQLLLQHGANVDNQDKDGNTILHYAVQTENAIIVKEVLKYGPDINNPSNRISLITAILCHRKCGKKTIKDALHAVKEYFTIVQELLKYGADVNARDDHGRTPLGSSIEYNDLEMTKLLLTNGAHVDTNVLNIAIRNGRNDIVEALLEHGVDINVSDRYGDTPLYVGAEKGCREIVETLLKFGADVNSINRCGRTALHVATGHGFTEIVISLLEYGADINISYLYHYLTPTLFYMRWNNPVDVLKRHIVKMKAANLYVSKENLISVSNINYKISDYQNKCEVEIANMKSEKINSTNITFHNIFTKDTNSLAMYMRNEDIVSALKSDEYKATFPIYADMIERNIRQGVERQELLEQCNKVFHNLFPILPDVCIDIVLSYLSNEDMRTLAH